MSVTEEEAPKRRQHVSFTAREVELVRAVARGWTLPEAAEELGWSLSMAQRRAVDVRMKLRVRTLREVPLAYWGMTGDNPYPTSPDA